MADTKLTMTDEEVRAFARDLVALAAQHGVSYVFTALIDPLNGPRFEWKDGKINITLPVRHETLEL